MVTNTSLDVLVGRSPIRFVAEKLYIFCPVTMASFKSPTILELRPVGAANIAGKDINE